MIASQITFAERMDEINDLLFFDKTKCSIDSKLIDLIVSRQINDGEKTGSFSLSPRDYQLGKWLFTGERLVTNLAIRNILSFSAAKILHMYKMNDKQVPSIINKAENWMTNSCFSRLCTTGECKHSTTGYIDYLAFIDKAKHKDKLVLYVEKLSEFRNKNQKWDGFPFYFTLQTLLEINLPIADQELIFALPACEKNLKSLNNANTKFSNRRLEITKRIIAKTYSTF